MRTVTRKQSKQTVVEKRKFDYMFQGSFFLNLLHPKSIFDLYFRRSFPFCLSLLVFVFVLFILTDVWICSHGKLKCVKLAVCIIVLLFCMIDCGACCVDLLSNRLGVFSWMRERERETEADRQIESETQTDRETDADRERQRRAHRQRDRWRETKRERERDSQRQKQRPARRVGKDRETEIITLETDRQTDRDRQT